MMRKWACGSDAEVAEVTSGIRRKAKEMMRKWVPKSAENCEKTCGSHFAEVGLLPLGNKNTDFRGSTPPWRRVHSAPSGVMVVVGFGRIVVGL